MRRSTFRTKFMLFKKPKFRNKNERIGMDVVRFYVHMSEKHLSGQGVVGITCNRLWEMEDEEFEELFS